MAYTIRYGPARVFQKPVRYCTMFQVLTAAVLLMTVTGVSQLWPEGKAVLDRWLLPHDLSAAESALRSMAACIASGEGWYVGAVTFCRMLLT